MRCKACDKLLNKIEMKRKNIISKQYEDLCSKCLKSIKSHKEELEVHEFADLIDEFNIEREWIDG